MRFGQTLREAVYGPWKDEYLDYSKLKSMLREDEDDSRSPWTDKDEQSFSNELINVQLDKVTAFQSSTFDKLQQRAARAGDKLRDLAPEDGQAKGDITKARFKEIEAELDGISNEANELKKFSSINYTGFLKVVKKHDRKRGGRYKIRPILQVNLAQRPFNSEQAYTPLLNKLSTYYFVVRHNLDDASAEAAPSMDGAQSQSANGDHYTAYKAWIHPDNLVEVRTYISRRLPTLVYSDNTAKEADFTQKDPSITSIYFDNANFELYGTKVDREADSSSLRVRWDGRLDDQRTVALEQKTIQPDGVSDESRINIKEKYVQPFIRGEYSMEKSVQKLERQQQPKAKVEEFKNTAAEIQEFIKKFDLQPVLRANYVRTAFQKPLDDRIRVSIDTNLTFIREDSLDSDRPCRRPENWHRLDIDDSKADDPFKNINLGEISRFPFAVLEIKVRSDGSKKSPQWVQDLMASHLVHRAPRFSKFVHGVASLFEDHVNNLPFWLSQIETDIRKDPHKAFEEEEHAKAQRAADDLVVGSYLGKSHRMSQSYQPAKSSPRGASYMADRLANEQSARARAKSNADTNGNGKAADSSEGNGSYGTMSSVFPSFSLSKYAQARRAKKVVLPEGVSKPGQLIKDSGPLKVEPKVWLANERTFLKWQHICILLGGLAVGLYTAAGKNRVAEFMGIAYICIAIFAGAWGYYMHFTRRNMIIARSGKDFDNLIGPMVVSVALMVALLINFVLSYQKAMGKLRGSGGIVEAMTSNHTEGAWQELI